MSSKRRRNAWDDDPMDFQTANRPRYEKAPEPFISEDDDGEIHYEEAEFLEEAHEALSRLFNKTNKRARQMKGVRRRDAWQ